MPAAKKPTVTRGELRELADVLDKCEGMESAPMASGQVTSPITYGLTPCARCIRDLMPWDGTDEVPGRTAARARAILRKEDERLERYQEWLGEQGGGRLAPAGWVIARYDTAAKATARLRGVIAKTLEFLDGTVKVAEMATDCLDLAGRAP